MAGLNNRMIGLAIVALICAAPSAAANEGGSVKAGVDAWSRQDFAAAIRAWQAPAAAGDADAQFNLGQAYRLGKGVDQDLARAERYFAQAAAQGHLQASDLYGLLLFQRGERATAMPYIRAAADRGDPRAQYYLGIAHFNGDNVPKDWVRAYALVSLAQQAGLANAQSARAQMDQHIPIEQRQQAMALAPELASQAQATRARQLAAVDLGSTVPSGAAPQPPLAAVAAPPTIAAAEDAVAAAERIAAGEGPRTAGADYARPGATMAALPEPGERPVHLAQPAPPPLPPRPVPPHVARLPDAPPIAQAETGSWRVQLGVFSVAANADALWSRVHARAELAGHPRILTVTGTATKLQAGGFASQDAARAACTRLSAAGFGCIAVRN